MALTEKLTAIAEAIRGKTGKMDGLTLDQMVVEIAGIQAGGEILQNPNSGMYFAPHTVMEPKDTYFAENWFRNGVRAFDYETRLLSFRSNFNVTGDNFFRGCVNMETLILDASFSTPSSNHWTCNGCTGLKTVQLGNVGKPVTGFYNTNYFKKCTQTGLTITVYVDKTTLADAQAITTAIPGEAVNATIIYRNSTTGEAITE